MEPQEPKKTDSPELNQSKDSSQNQTQQKTELPDVGKLLKEQFYKLFGLKGFTFLFAIGILWWIWTNRTQLSALPVVSSIVEWISQISTPHLDEKRFSILIANRVDERVSNTPAGVRPFNGKRALWRVRTI
jgi:hypothetical protein